MNSMLTFSGI